MSLTLLLAFVCTTAAMDNCSVWQEGAWAGAAAETYCTVERDLATVRLLPNQHIRYECETVEADETAIATLEGAN